MPWRLKDQAASIIQPLSRAPKPDSQHAEAENDMTTYNRWVLWKLHESPEDSVLPLGSPLEGLPP